MKRGKIEIGTMVTNFEKIFNKISTSKSVHECVIYIEDGKGEFKWNRGYGNRNIDSPLLMSSVTKLFTTACILILQEQGVIQLSDKLTKYFPKDLLNGMHIYKGKEYSFELTIENLICQTSGFPDIFSEGKNNLNKRLIEQDFYITFEEYVELTKKFPKKFAPNTPKRVYYSDMNFEMLGKIIEKVTDKTLGEVYKNLIFEPLKLEHTYLPECEEEFVPHLYYKDNVIKRPKIILSIPACGGCVSTAREIMKFTKAFFQGELFNKKTFEDLCKYKKLQITMGNMEYGCGCERISLDGISTLFRGKGKLYGHIGMSGAFTFYYPQEDFYILGDVSQLAKPGLAIILPMRLAMSIK